MMHDYEAYQRRLRTTSARASLHQKLLESCGLADPANDTSGGKHHETSPAEIKRNEQCVQRVSKAFDGFLDPFDITDQAHLYNIASGAPVSKEVEEDVLKTNKSGRNAKAAFIHDRLDPSNATLLFYDPIKNFNWRM